MFGRLKNFKNTQPNHVVWPVIGIIMFTYYLILMGLDVIPSGTVGVATEFLKLNPTTTTDVIFWTDFGMFSASSICMVLLGVPLGYLIAKWSLRQAFILALALLSVSGWLSYTADGIAIFVLSRFLFGLGYILAEIAYVNIVDLYILDKIKKAKMFTILSNSNMLSSVGFGIAVSFFPTDVYWRQFSFLLCLASLAIPFAIRYIEEPNKASLLQGNKRKTKKKPTNNSSMLGWLTFSSVCIGQTLFCMVFSTVLLKTSSFASLFSSKSYISGTLLITLFGSSTVVSTILRFTSPKVNGGKMYIIGMLMTISGITSLWGCSNFGSISFLYFGYFLFGSGAGTIFGNVILYFYEVNQMKTTSSLGGINAMFSGIGYILSPFVIKVNSSISPDYIISYIYPCMICAALVLNSVFYFLGGFGAKNLSSKTSKNKSFSTQ